MGAHAGPGHVSAAFTRTAAALGAFALTYLLVVGVGRAASRAPTACPDHAQGRASAPCPGAPRNSGAVRARGLATIVGSEVGPR